VHEFQDPCHDRIILAARMMAHSDLPGTGASGSPLFARQSIQPLIFTSKVAGSLGPIRTTRNRDKDDE